MEIKPWQKWRYKDCGCEFVLGEQNSDISFAFRGGPFPCRLTLTVRHCFVSFESLELHGELLEDAPAAPAPHPLFSSISIRPQWLEPEMDPLPEPSYATYAPVYFGAQGMIRFDAKGLKAIWGVAKPGCSDCGEDRPLGYGNLCWDCSVIKDQRAAARMDEQKRIVAKAPADPLGLPGAPVRPPGSIGDTAGRGIWRLR